MSSIKATSVRCDVPFKMHSLFLAWICQTLSVISFEEWGDNIHWIAQWSPQASLCDPAAAGAPLVELTVKCQSFTEQEGVIQRQFNLLLVAVINHTHDAEGQPGLKAPGDNKPYKLDSASFPALNQCFAEYRFNGTPMLFLPGSRLQCFIFHSFLVSNGFSWLGRCYQMRQGYWNRAPYRTFKQCSNVGLSCISIIYTLLFFLHALSPLLIIYSIPPLFYF